jgi:hypothetical protein
MTGFSHIRSKFKTKCKIEKPLEKLAMWFTYSNEFLFVHDMEDHKTSMPLAQRKTENENNWVIFLKPNSPGELLVNEAINNEKLRPDEDLNNNYRQSGYFPFRLLK